MSFEVGDSVGSYLLLERLKASEAGVSYKARNSVLERFETLKVLPVELQTDIDRVERFLREAKLHSRLEHPNIARFYDAKMMEGRLVLTTELVEGATLEQRIQIGPIPVSLAASHMIQVLGGLSRAHELGIVHRNLSPSVMVITADGLIKLTGFDLAKTKADAQLTMPGSVIGTVDYISPEQVKGSREVDVRADIYAIGAILYHLLTGSKPFPDGGKFDVMLAHVQAEPRPPSELREHLPEGLSEVVLRAMAKDPTQRYQTAAELTAALKPYQAEQPILARTEESLKAALGAARPEPPPEDRNDVDGATDPPLSAEPWPQDTAAALAEPVAAESAASDFRYLLTFGGVVLLVATATFILFLSFLTRE